MAECRGKHIKVASQWGWWLHHLVRFSLEIDWVEFGKHVLALAQTFETDVITRFAVPPTHCLPHRILVGCCNRFGRFPLENFDDGAVRGSHHIRWPICRQSLTPQYWQVLPCELKKLLILSRTWPISNDNKLSHIESPFSAPDLTRQR